MSDTPREWKVGDSCYCPEGHFSDGYERRNEGNIPGIIIGIEEGSAKIRLLDGMWSCPKLTDIWPCSTQQLDEYVSEQFETHTKAQQLALTTFTETVERKANFEERLRLLGLHKNIPEKAQ